VTNCGPGKYGAATFSARGFVQSAECYSCDNSCAECVGSGTGQCTSCKAGFYLERWTGTKTFGAGDMVKYGTCKSKTVYALNGGVFTRDVWAPNDGKAQNANV